MNQKPDKTNSNEPSNLDFHDEKILKVLSSDGRISISELARRINLSKTPTQARVKRLEAEGFILGYRAMLNPIRMGLDHVAFVEVTLNDTREAALTKFNNEAAKIGEIEQCHMIAGNFDYLLKVRTQSMRAYRQVLGEKISALPYVANTKTFVAMQSVKEV
ncbi:Lrp/AsnC family transcriptional regulator [Reinekea thalattae]|uniref:Leucine-responsive regulatory protein n=1 Tax=Reinekea thalattae TaxID=2593301 RepID=A0A5C8ZA45_9GAMM|nr:Lrp/AsnC ligand binding domain-containing protein [Reinekea thalattae]TXR54637.1 winged helix-turn-helix transcriptional regulator [Reinekea thalattae]